MIAGVLLAAITLAPSACETPATATKDATLSLTVIRSEGVSRKQANAIVEGATAVLAPYRLKLQAKHAVSKVEGPAFASRSAHPPTSDFLARIVQSMDPVRGFVVKHTRAKQVTVWLLPQITAPDSQLRRVLLGDPPGLTLVDQPESLGANAGLKAGAPVVLLSLSAGANGRTLAHEIGHAAGLEHRRGKGALMAEQPGACPPALNATELSAFVALAAELGAPRAFK